MRHLCVVLALVACKQSKPAATEASGSAPPVAADAIAIDAPVVVDAVAIDAAPPVVEPPTADSVHVEVGRAMRRWAKDPKDKTLYANDFGGRAEPDARIEPLGTDAWLASLPASSKIAFSEVKTWLDAGSKLGEGESKTHVSFWYDGKDDYRELLWKREGGQQRLVSIQTNSRNSKAEADWRDSRIYFPLDAKPLGTQLTAWVRAEGDLAWLVVASDKGQVVADLWPNAGTTCGVDYPIKDPVPDGPIAVMLCTGVGEGNDFAFARDKDTLVVQLAPLEKGAHSTIDRRIELAKGAKLRFQPAP